MPTVEIPLPRQHATLEEVTQIVAQLSETLGWLLEGNLDSKNVREIAGFIVDLLTLKHKTGLVGMSAADPNNPDAVRLWAGGVDMAVAPWRVLQKGSFYATDAFISGLITGSIITGSMIIGSEIKTSETEFPRIELSSLGTFFKALGSADKSIEISVSTEGTPGLFFKDPAGLALINIGTTSFAILSTIAMALSAPTVSAGGIWTFNNTINGNITGHAASADYADHAGTASAADELSPSGEISWGQVIKNGSNIADLETKNLSSLTQNTSYRTVSDAEKSIWNEKVGALSGGNRIQSDIVSFVAAANSYTSFTVTFDAPFNSAPMGFVTLSQSETHFGSGVDLETTADMRITIHNTSAADALITAKWFAVGS